MKKALPKSFDEMIREMIKESRQIVTEDRKLRYEPDEIGITALLQCPLKFEFRKKYPEIKTESAAADDGYRFEYVIKNAFKRAAGEKFKEEVELPYQVLGQKIRGHLDCLIEFNDEVIGFELKAPQLILLKKIPPKEFLERNILIDTEREEDFLIVNPVYKTQAKIEKFLLSELYPDKDVRLFLFQFGICKHGSFIRKLYTFYEVESIKKSDLEYLVLKFLHEKGPRFKNECESYCAYNLICDRAGERESVTYDLDKFSEVADPGLKEFVSLYKEYCMLKEQMTGLEKLMQKTISGSCIIGGREVGWIEREKVNYDIDLIVKWLTEKKVPLSEFLNVTTSSKKRKFIEQSLPKAVISKEKITVFKV